MRSATCLTISNHFQDAGNVSRACLPFGKQEYPSYTPRPKVKQTTAIARTQLRQTQVG